MNVRLTQREIDAIVSAVKAVDQRWEVYLYGSRVDPDLRGGDIDLLVVIPQDQGQNPPCHDYQLVNRIKKVIGDRRIDLSLVSEEDCIHDAFYKLIWPKSVKLTHD
jgi:predicted nucleotidyltransferase